MRGESQSVKPFLTVVCSALGLAVLATSASARYFEFYDCGKSQPFVSHDIIKSLSGNIKRDYKVFGA